jgi:glycosyltransferase involved in cell wall biosynthesis
VPLALEHRALYASFDRFPSRKGSAIHIDRFARTLFERAGGGLLYVLGGNGLPPYQREGGVEIVRFSQERQNYLERALAFAARLEALLAREASALRLAHFRDPWSGMAILERRPEGCVAIYEVNGLPSVELPYLHPAVPPGTLRQIAAVEQRCLEGADAIVVPSPTIAAALRRRGVDDERIRVIPNGAELPAPTARPPDGPARYVLYFGALQPWQGLDTALRALARMSDLEDLHLVVCASVHRRKAKPYRKLAERLGVAERVHWRFALPEDELAPWREHALASLAPLRDCARNVAQGCAPLKVLESMASGVPVVASDLPVVRELMDDCAQGLLVPPDRPGELARAVRTLADLPERAEAMGAAGRARVAERFTWSASVGALGELYGELEPGWIDAVPEGSLT